MPWPHEVLAIGKELLPRGSRAPPRAVVLFTDCQSSMGFGQGYQVIVFLVNSCFSCNDLGSF